MWAALCCTSCGDDPSDAPRDTGPVVLPGPDAVTSPRYDRIWAIGTHNSYWVDRGAKDDTFASGTNLRFVDQLVAGRARSLEIDVHRDPATPGRFRVYHTVPGNDLCDDLRDCLAAIRVFHRALPKHEPLNLAIELKELFASNFDDAHTIEDLDRVLREELPAMLYSPADFLARCDRETDAAKVKHETLSACAARKDWPGIDQLRGKVIVSLLGNWDDLGAAQATSDWVRYATKDDVRLRVAFPMASSWKLSWPDLTTRVQELVTQQDLDAAFAQSVFLQIEALDDPKIDPFLAKHGVIRVDGANTKDDQAQRIARGMQLMQTDTPFVRFGAGEPMSAFAALDGSEAPLSEPGARLLLARHPEADGRVFAWAPFPDAATTTTWEALVSAGSTNAIGCLRAAVDDTASSASFMVCRSRVEGSAIGAGEKNQNARVQLTICGVEPACSAKSFASSEPALGGVGDLLQLVVRRDATRTCARARSAATVGRDLAPAWTDVGDEVCFEAKLARIGLVRAWSDGADPAWFVSAQRDGAPVTASMLNVSLEGGTGAPRIDASSLVDATVP